MLPKALLYFLLIAILTTGPHAAADPPAHALPESIKLVYSATFGGTRLGSLVASLTKDDEHYRVEAETLAEGVAAILLGGALTESCEFTFSGDSRLQPKLYQSEKQGLRAYSHQAEFSWETNQVHYDSGDVIDIPPAGYVLDNCSVPYAFNPIITGSISEYPYLHIITGNRIRHYEGMKVSQEVLNTDIGEFLTTRIDQHRVERPDKTLSFWVAPELHNIAIKIMEQRPSRQPITFLLESMEEVAEN